MIQRNSSIAAALFLFLILACSTPRDTFTDPAIDGLAPDPGRYPERGDAGTPPTRDPETCEDARHAKTYVGCEYWPTVTFNPVWSIFDFAVVISNVGSKEATVTITSPGGATRQESVPAGALKKIQLPWIRSLKGADQDDCAHIDPHVASLGSVFEKRGAFHLVSSSPVIAYQFNALEYRGGGGEGPNGGPKDWSTCPPPGVCASSLGCYSFSNDASLLLPAAAMTGTYRIVGNRGNTGDPQSSTNRQDMGPFLAITATEDATDVNVTLAVGARVMAGSGGIRAAGPGEVVSLHMDAGDVVELEGARGEEGDFSGSLVRATKPVQVISGNPCATFPRYVAACDHTEETVFPAETLGKHYVISAPTGPNGTKVGHLVRLYGNVDGTRLTYEPQIPPGCPVTLDAGQFTECTLGNTDFEVSGDHEFAAVTFMLGGTMVDPHTDPLVPNKGDPSMSLYASVEQFRTRYLFLAPSDYEIAYADIVGTIDSKVVVDDVPHDATSFQPIGGKSAYGVFRVKLGPGTGGSHRITADKPVGIQVLGYGAFTSFQYPAGLNLSWIAAPPK